VTETVEHTARKIAEQGREALLARLRPAFEQAAATHGEGLELDEEQLERMVQRAADRADGLQWRRALAQVATEQLGIGLGEALGHPAVARAQAIVGAPSYEEALGDLGGGKPAPAEEAAAEPASEPEPEPEAAEAPDADASEPSEPAAEDESKPTPDEPADEESPEPEVEKAPDEQAESAEEPEHEPAPVAAPTPAPAASMPARAPAPAPAAADTAAPSALRLRAVHLGGIANLAPAEGDLELHLSDAGLDIVRGPERTPLGRLTWDEIVALEAPAVGGRFRRKRQGDAHMVIRSAQGSASFEIPGVTTDELSEHLAPMLARHQK
jgi:hypothetical protein